MISDELLNLLESYFIDNTLIIRYRSNFIFIAKGVSLV